MNVEKLKKHVEALRQKHREYDDKINESYLHYDPDEKIKQLKVQKLQVRKEIEWLEHEISSAGGAV